MGEKKTHQQTGKNQHLCGTIHDVYENRYQFFFCYVASRVLNDTCRMTLTEVKALPECLGFTP